MAQTLKSLGQVALALADTEYELYAVPLGKETVVSSLSICNRTALDQTFRVSVDVRNDNESGAEAEDFVYFDTEVPANDTFMATVGLTLGPGDSINVYGSHADMTFAAWGRETPIVA
jgi:hypothetical protein